MFTIFSSNNNFIHKEKNPLVISHWGFAIIICNIIITACGRLSIHETYVVHGITNQIFMTFQ